MTADKGKQEYMTAGQLAKEVGVTIRTVQYYDQQRLLAPSAKGANNQRLYTHDDEVALYRILTLKYLGLSLSDIREKQEAFDDPESFERLVGEALGTLEEDFQGLIKRLGTLRAMMSDTAEREETDWTSLAHAIESGQNDSYVWFGTASDQGESVPPSPTENRKRGMAVGAWHELIAKVIPLLTQGVPADSPAAQAIAKRYLELQEQQGGSIEESFLLMENISPDRSADGSFNLLRQQVSEYLNKAADIARANGAGAQGATANGAGAHE